MSKGTGMNRFTDDMKTEDQVAFAAAVQEYRPLIESLVARFSTSGEEDDLRQEALIALYSAFCSYDFGQKQVTFGLYAKICIRNRLISVARRHKPDEAVADDGEEQLWEDGDDPEEILLAGERYRDLLRVIDESLTPLEKKILTLYLEDISYAQIAKQLNVTEKSVDNAIYRLKAKLRKRI